MKIQYRELNSNGYILRGLFSTPDTEYRTVAAMFHGFTGHMNENGFLYKQLTKTLTDINIATLRYDFMGSGISDGEFTEMSFFTEYEDAKKVILEAYELNHRRPIIVIGFSMGGAVSARVSLEMKDYIEKLVLLAPAGNLPLLMKGRFERLPVSEAGNIDLGGFELNEVIAKTLADYNMYKDIETFEKPVLIMQGGADEAVPPMYSKKFDELYPNSEYILIEGSAHCFTKVPFRKIVNDKVREFLK